MTVAGLVDRRRMVGMHRFSWPLAAIVFAPLVGPTACFLPESPAGGDTDDGDDAPADSGDDGSSGTPQPSETGSDPTSNSTTEPTGTVDDTGDETTGDTGTQPEGGHVAYVLEGGLHVQAATPGSEPRALTPELDALAPGVDEGFVQLSSDGEWLLLSSERFDAQCAGYPCLSVVDIGVTAGEAVLDPGGAPIRYGSGNGGAITRGGSAIAFGGEGGVHTRDLLFTTRAETGWSTPIVLTADSPYDFNTMPRFDVNEQLLVFDCGPAPYGDIGTAICEVGIDGSGFRVVWTPDQAPAGGTAGGFLHHPSYTPDGGIVFEAAWTGEQVWVLANGAAEPVLLRPDHNNDNAPCVLPDGRVVSLWLGRRGSAGIHELAIKAADGSGDDMLLIERDIADVGTACGL